MGFSSAGVSWLRNREAGAPPSLSVCGAHITEERPARLAEIGQRFPNAYQIDNLETLLQLEDVDAVVVCTGASTHFEVASRCIKAGKHVLIEKPLTTKPADAERLIVVGFFDPIMERIPFEEVRARLGAHIEDKLLGIRETA